MPHQKRCNTILNFGIFWKVCCNEKLSIVRAGTNFAMKNRVSHMPEPILQ